MAGSSVEYEDTVSQMARKYAPVHMHVLNMTKSMPRIIHEETSEEHEDDIAPIFVTMKSIDSLQHGYHHGHHNSASSISSLSLMSPLTPHQNEDELGFEVPAALVSSPVHKQVFLDIFDHYFDESKEGDVDMHEFGDGLAKLGIAVSSEQLRSLFSILLTPSGRSGDCTPSERYLERGQFAELMSRRGHGVDARLASLQALLIKAAGSISEDTRRRHHRRHSCIKVEDAQQWQAAEVSLAEIAMRSEMERMLSDESQKLIAGAHSKRLSDKVCAVLQCDFAVTDVAIGGETSEVERENQRLRHMVHSLKKRVRRRDLTIERMQREIESESSSDRGADSADSSDEETEEEGSRSRGGGNGRTEDAGFLRRFFGRIACSAEENITDSGDVSKGY